MKIEDLEKALQYFVIAVPESEEQAKAYFWARKALTALRSMQEAGEPFHIDRSKWEYCLTCRDLRYLPYEVCAGIKMPGGSEFGASFCPSCGRPLTEEAWAELERRLMG